MKLSIKNTRQEFSDKVLKELWHVLEVINQDEKNDPELCNMTIEDVVDYYLSEEKLGEELNQLSRDMALERKLGLIALRSVNANTPSKVIEIRELRLIGDGPCPHCGGDSFIERGLTDTCLICGHDWVPEYETINTNSYE